MGKWSDSLLNQDRVRAIAEGARKGPVGLLAGRLPPEASAWPKKKLKLWSEGRPDIVWAWLSDRTLLLALRLPEDKRRLEEVLARTETHLRQIACERPEAPGPIGFGFVPAGASPYDRQAEQRLLDTIADALSLAKTALNADAAKLAKRIRERENSEQKGDGSRDSGKDRVLQAAEAPLRDISGMEIGRLAAPMPVMAPHTLVAAAAEWFESHPDCHGIVVGLGTAPQGLVTRERLNGMLASKFGVPLYWHRTIDKIMEGAPLVAEADVPVETVARRAMKRSDSQLYDAVIVTERGNCIGGVTVKVLLESFASLQAEAARRVNPLTGLPGGDSIRREIEARVKAKRPFSVYYADLDYFKWFNDSYGYSAGDDMIKYTASALGSVLGESEEDKPGSMGTNGALGANGALGMNGFLGHIGGDDFIAISERSDAEACCRSFIDRFHEGVDAFYGEARPMTVVNRHGTKVEQPGVSLSIAVVRWDGSRAVSHEQLSQWAAACKKTAKDKPGSSYAIYEASFSEQL
ncbi:GGDEF domain-containing protein [Cohnella fermenti]|uniref:GGDEF domain-containing protein n=1 Tax=Cohnella fermenti TaxID=2565925 RepID=UPI001454C275|nr:GGDEF domain-containing protein [Cohnella fermenti]